MAGNHRSYCISLWVSVALLFIRTTHFASSFVVTPTGRIQTTITTTTTTTSITSTNRRATTTSNEEDDYNNNDDASSASSSSKTEFSRSLFTDRIFKTSSGNYRQQRNTRNHEMDIEATIEECEKLAQRFDLKNIAQLSATLSLQRCTNSLYDGVVDGGSSEYSKGQTAVQVEGTISAKVTQTCVRTNEDFQVDLDLPLFAIVRPTATAAAAADTSTSSGTSRATSSSSSSPSSGDGFQSYNNNKNKKKQNKKPAKTNYKDDMQELQRLLSQQESIDAQEEFTKGNKKNNQNQLSLDNDFFQSILEEDSSIVEDEAIYSSINGRLDVGELVAQTFWLQLDPYPKKPGTNPMKFSISG